MKLPRLGAVLLATIARQHGWEAKVYVEDIAPVDYQDVLTADVVGISSITSTAERAYAMADALRPYHVPIVMGGPHPTFMVDEALTHCDYVVRGEGEEALPLLLAAIRSGRGLETVPNLSYRDSEGVTHHNPQTSTIEDLDSLPYPDFNLIVGWRLEKSFNGRPIVPIQSTRGCPYGCKFCSVIGMFGRKMRFRSTAHVLGEIEQYQGQPMHIFFYDDNFTANTQRAKEIIRSSLVERQMAASWSAQVRTDAARDGELLQLMRETNCTSLYIGFESVNPAALREMNKKQDVDTITQAVTKFNEYGVDVHGMFIIGFDSDDRETIRETLRFARRSGIASAQFLILTPLPGTPMFDELRDAGRLKTMSWSNYDAHHVVYVPKNISALELQWAQITGHARFYSLRRAVDRFANGQLTNAFIYLYANKMNRQWKRANRVYLKLLKLAERARGIHLSFDYRFDFGEIFLQVQAAAQGLIGA